MVPQVTPRDGQLPKRATFQTVAEAVGVSKTTVSNAYSRPDQLSPSLRDKTPLCVSDIPWR